MGRATITPQERYPNLLKECGGVLTTDILAGADPLDIQKARLSARFAGGAANPGRSDRYHPVLAPRAGQSGNERKVAEGLKLRSRPARSRAWTRL